jgi:predicted nucleic acid-binding protein
LHEFLAIVTHPRIFDPPSPLAAALAQVDAWLESPALVLLSERFDHWEHLRGLVGAGDARGPRVHDARVAALCLAHGVRELWTADRDFGRFPALRARNPLVG